MIQNYFTNYIERIKYIIALEGDRLTSFHYNQIKKNIRKKKQEKEMEFEEEMPNDKSEEEILEKMEFKEEMPEYIDFEEEIIEKNKEIEPRMKLIYNNAQLIEDKKKEIRKMKGATIEKK